jgi:hypothetical protein
VVSFPQIPQKTMYNNNNNNNNKQSSRWLKFWNIKGEAESTIVAAQIKQLVQTILKVKFWKKKFRVNASYVNTMKKLLTT